MNVLVVDIGGSNVKVLATGQTDVRKIPSGPTMTPEAMVAGVKALTQDWAYEAVAIGYPGLVHRGVVTKEPYNLGPGWIGFDFEAAFGCPVRIINDAAMQALGSYESGTMLFLGLGTGLGSAMVVEGVVVPLELAHLPYKKGTYEHYLGKRALERLDKKKWREYVETCVGHLTAALQLDDVVIGGGQIKLLKELPTGCRLGHNSNAFVGGFRLWEPGRERFSAAS
ncbi:ROK family protein [Leptolyngbya sp. KIOST-1]|uniref:ROK family protein n=1 Tax=Leptolyngbya sp. KIOST-1 TaxID=1229172 RepID=UPI000563122B|nr:ROK family protein [Leptolyngbya sp. KIOST-1]